jgi:hypothetical protein
VSQIPETSPEGWSDLPVDPAGYAQPGAAPQNPYAQQYYAPQPAPAGYPAADDGNVPVLSEFDHLFRDSDPVDRRSVVQNAPAVRVSGEVAVPGPAAQQYPGLNPVPPPWPAQNGMQQNATQALPQNNGQQDPTQNLGSSPALNQTTQYPPQQYPQQNGAPEEQYGQQYGQQWTEQQQQQYAQQQYEQQQYEQNNLLPQTQTGYGEQAQTPFQAFQPYQPTPPDGDGGEQQWLGRNGGSKRTPLLIGGGVVVVAVIALFLALGNGNSGKPQNQASGAPKTTAPVTSAAQQATALMTIVGQSGQLRSAAISAVSDLSSSSCSQLTQDQSSLQATAKARSAQATAVSALNVSKLPGGAALVADLSQAWQASATSDTAYAGIAGDMASSNVTDCKSNWKKDSNYPAATQADGEATRDKAAAASLWNSDLTAAPISEPTINDNQL